MKKIKNVFLTLGTTIAFSAPITTIIACNDEDKSKFELNGELLEKLRSDAPSSDDTKETKEDKALESDKLSLDKDLKKESKKDETDSLFQVSEDGLYLVNDGVKNSTLYDAKKMFEVGKGGTKSSKRIEKIENGSWMNYVVQVEKGDSIYMIYDADDQDGFAPSTFLKNIFFNDTSIMQTAEIKYINEKNGNLSYQGGTYNTLIPFRENGLLNLYIGSQSNHTSMKFEEALEKIKDDKSLTQEAIEAIDAYYKHYHKAFVPLSFDNPIWKYEQIEPRVFKITLNSSSAQITAARFVLRSTTNLNNVSFPGIFSIGKEDWSFYNHPGYRFISKKNN